MISEMSSQIGALRVTGCNADTPAVRLSIDHMLHGVNWHPPGIPPSAILIVRYMAEKLPAHTSVIQGPSNARTVWEPTLHQALLANYRRAVRPIEGEASANGEAILFSDYGELLACYLMDVSSNRVQDHWWWHVMMRSHQAEISDNLEETVCQNVHYLPGALGVISQRSSVKYVIQTLSPDAARQVLRALLEAYGTDDETLFGDSIQPSPRDSSSISQGMPTRIGQMEYHLDQPDPWQAWVPASINLHAMSREHACLLVVALSLNRRPSILHEPSFIHALQRLWKQTDPPNQNEPIKRRSQSTNAIQERETADFSSTEETAHNESRYQIKPQNDIKTDSVDDSGESSTDQNAILPESAHKEQRVDASLQPGVQQYSSQLSEDQTNGAYTQLGGILYLINLMQQLNLPECFQSDWRLANRPGPWGVLNILARGLLGKLGDPYIEDPIWGTLDDLSGGRPEMFIGDGLSGVQIFRLPRAWRRFLPELDTTWYWGTNGKRLRIWFENGCLLIDAPIQTNGSPFDTQVNRQLHHYLSGGVVQEALSRSALIHRKFDQAPIEDIEGKLVEGLNPDLAWWLKRVLPAIRTCLCEMLQMDQAEKNTVAEFLLLVPGKIYCTGTHVDLVTSLEEISLPVRIAGLDFDPGWLPNFGRAVKFHFR